jgi:hypothetical protein
MITFLINLCFSLPARFLISKPFLYLLIHVILLQLNFFHGVKRSVMPIYTCVCVFYIDKTKIESDPSIAHIILAISQILCGLSMNCLVWVRNLPLNVSSGTLLI